MKFAAALFLMMGTSSALRISQSLSDVAKKQAAVNPALRKKDRQLKKSVESKLSAMAVPKRMLEDNNNNNNNNGNYQNGDGQMDWNQYMSDQMIGFDISSYAVKYTQCATVQTYSDDLAENEYADTVLAAKRFALFRLCPKDQCTSYSANGCGSNYGEYMVSLDQFLLAMMEYQETRVKGYCQYCQECASIEAAKHFWATVYNDRDYALKQAQSSYNSWYTAYLESYYNGNNNGDADGNDGNGYQQMDSNTAAQQYYQQVRNSNNYANTYAQNYYSNGNQNNNNAAGYQGSYGTNQYSWMSENMWQFQNTASTYQQNQNTWQNMGSPSGSFYGQTVLNGYYDGDGVFNQVYGYFNADGDYISLEDDAITWDETLFGEQPDGWDAVTDETESCNYVYAGSCANQYDSCMQILEDQTYQEYQQYKNGNNNNGQAQPVDQASVKDFLGCVEVEQNANNQWAINQYYQQNGGGNNNNNAQGNYDYDCEGNDYCQQQQEYYENVQNYNQEQQQNRRYFIGPHCGSNSRAISLAVYRDPYCSVIDDTTSVETLLGYQPASEAIDLFPDECMNCLNDGTEQPWYEDEEQYGLEPMCSMLYQFSGKCNKNLDAVEYSNNDYSAYQDANADQYQYQYNNGEGGEGNEEARQQYEYQWKLMYQSMQQEANEEAVCSFIESLSSNTYNEYGEVTVADHAWSSFSSSIAKTKAMSPGMLAGLVITAIAAASMAVAACVLHGSLARKNIPWKPRRKQGEDPTDLARQNSGITMGRSRSNVGTNPLL